MGFNRVKRLALEYLSIVIYILMAIFIEVSGAFVTDGTFYINDPRYLITMIGIITCILVMIRKQKARLITEAVFLYTHMVINVVFILVFEMTEQWFDFSMFSLRSDAMGILENLPINFWYIFPWFFVITTYLVLGYKALTPIENLIEKYKGEEGRWVKPVIFSTTGLLIVVFGMFNILTGYLINGNLKIDKYDDLIHSNVSSLYNQYGATNNFLNELYRKGIFYDETNLPSDEIESYVYGNGVYTGQNSGDYHGISSGNNVITILGETLEWYGILTAEEWESNDGRNSGYLDLGNGDMMYIENGTGLSKTAMASLYPNITKLYNNSYVMTNYHAREKTDISESYSILGSYPVDSFIHYDYAENLKLQSAPNVMRDYYNQQGEEFSAQYFHDGYENFYNRRKAIPGFGFDSYKLTDQMKYNQHYYDYGSRGERNFDSQMIDACKDEMFPTNKKFYTYITTITTHGLYQRQRDNLSDVALSDEECIERGLPLGTHINYYEELYKASYNAEKGTHTLPKVEDVEGLDLSLYTYLSAIRETDRMLGKIFSELENRESDSTGRKLIEDTTIVIFGDHQAYYEGLSNYVKGIYNGDQAIADGINYNDLYNVPCLIYDKKLVKKATNNGLNPNGRISNRFSSSCDIVPTLLDLLGINFYEGMYYGHSMFDNVNETIIYSRGYGYWVSNYSYLRNINNFKYINPVALDIYGSKEAYINHVDEIATALTKNIKYIDNLYKTDMFDVKSSYDKYKDNMYTINAWNKDKIKPYQGK